MKMLTSMASQYLSVFKKKENKKRIFFMPCKYCICERERERETTAQNTTGVSVQKQQKPETRLTMSTRQTQADHVLQEKEVHSGIINTSHTLSF